MPAKFLSQRSLYSGNYFYVERNNENEVDYGLHYHDFYEVHFYKSISGILIINNKEYKVHSGDITLINVFEPHMLILDKMFVQERFCLNFGPDFLLSSSSDRSNLLNIFSSGSKKYPLLHLNETEFASYASILSRLGSKELDYGHDILEKALLYELLANLYNHFYDGCKPDSTDPQVAVIIRLIGFIEEHLAEDLSLQRLADEVNFSKFHLCRVFKKHTGYTLNQYIVSKRMERSKYLLNGDTPISEISKITGFHNYSYFYKTFKNTYGISPAELRNSCSSKP